MSSTGIHGKMHNAIKSLYDRTSSCVKVNGSLTDWFKVKTGLRQCCGLSPVLFSFFINDLAVKLKNLGYGIDIGNVEKVCILLYAEDIVLLSENENDLQLMLNLLHEWSRKIKFLLTQIKVMWYILDHDIHL